jgi:hypothetical protein
VIDVVLWLHIEIDNGCGGLTLLLLQQRSFSGMKISTVKMLLLTEIRNRQAAGLLLLNNGLPLLRRTSSHTLLLG